MRTTLICLLFLFGTGCAPRKHYQAWTIEVSRTNRNVRVELHHNDYPEGPEDVSFDGRRMKVVREGGRSGTFLAGPGGFGPSTRSLTPLYRIQLAKQDKLERPVTVFVDGKRLSVQIADLGDREFRLADPSAPIHPGGRVLLTYRPGPKVADPVGSWSLELRYRAQADGDKGNWKLWCDARRNLMDPEPKFRWTPERTLEVRVPDDAPAGPGTLWIAGYMAAGILSCKAKGCSATVFVDLKIPIVISPTPPAASPATPEAPTARD